MTTTVDKWIERKKSATRASKGYFRKVRQSLSYYVGRQWLYERNGAWYDKNEMFPILTETSSKRETRNIFRSKMDAIAARILLDPPVVEAYSPTHEHRRINASRYANHLLKYLEYKQKLKAKQYRIATLQCVSGIAYWKIYWDSSVEATYLTEQGSPSREIIGDVAFDVINPIEVLIEPGFTFPEDATWFIHMQKQPKSFMKKFKNIPEPTSEDMRAVSPEQKALSYGVDADVRKNETYEKENFVIILECYDKKVNTETNNYSWEVTTIAAGSGEGKVLQRITLDYCPFVSVPYAQVEGMSTPTTPAFDALEIQDEINKHSSRLAEYVQGCTHPQIWINGIATQLMGDEITNEPNKVYRGTGPPPEFLVRPPLPSTIENYTYMLTQKMDEVTGIHQVSQGRSPYSGSSGELVKVLQRQDITNLSIAVMNFKTAYLQAHRTALSIAQKNYTQKRQIEYGGQNSQIYIMDFAGADIDQGIDVRLRMGTSIPMSQSDKIQLGLQLASNGFFNKGNEEVRRNFLKFIGSENAFPEETDFDLERQNADLENRKMSAGEEAQVFLYQRHKEHIDIHKEFTHTQEFINLKPQIQMIFQNHITLHIYTEVMLQMQQMQAMTMVQMSSQMPLPAQSPQIESAPQPQPQEKGA